MATTGIPRAAGYSDYSSTGTGGQFIRELWSTLLAEKVYQNTVFDSITNREYEQEIRRLGDTIHIRTQPNVTASTYEIGQTLTYQVPTSTPTNLTIDQGLYWAFQIDTIDLYESDINLFDTFAENAVRSMLVAQDQKLLATAPSQVAAANSGATAGALSGNINLGDTAAPLVITKTNAIDALLLSAKQVLDEQNVPMDGQRFIVLPSSLIRQILGSDLKYAYETGDAESPLRSGYTGTIAGFDVYQSNNTLPVADGSLSAYNCYFGWKPGIAWANQFLDNQIVKLVTQAGWGAYSVCAFGFNTIVPAFTGNAFAIPSANYV